MVAPVVCLSVKALSCYGVVYSLPVRTETAIFNYIHAP